MKESASYFNNFSDVPATESDEISHLPNASEGLIKIHNDSIVKAVEEGNLELLKLLIGPGLYEAVETFEKTQEFNVDRVWNLLLTVRLAVLREHIKEISDQVEGSTKDFKPEYKKVFNEILGFLQVDCGYPSDNMINTFILDKKAKLSNMVQKYPTAESVACHPNHFQKSLWNKMSKSQELKEFKNGMIVSGGVLKDKFEAIMKPIAIHRSMSVQTIILLFLESGIQALKDLRDLRDKIPSSEYKLIMQKEHLKVKHRRNLDLLFRNNNPLFNEFNLKGSDLKYLDEPLQNGVDIAKINKAEQNLLEVLCTLENYRTRPDMREAYKSCSEYIVKLCLVSHREFLISHALYLYYKKMEIEYLKEKENNPIKTKCRDNINMEIVENIFSVVMKCHDKSYLEKLKIKPSLIEETVLTHSLSYIQTRIANGWGIWCRNLFRTKEELSKFLTMAYLYLGLTKLGNITEGDEALASGLFFTLKPQPKTWMEYFQSFFDPNPHACLRPMLDNYCETSARGDASVGFILGARQELKMANEKSKKMEERAEKSEEKLAVANKTIDERDELIKQLLSERQKLYNKMRDGDTSSNYETNKNDFPLNS